MTDEELKNKCIERVKIFQQAMESCHSSNPIACIEWFADRIKELEKENAELKVKVGLSIDCEKAQKDGELCLGYGGDEDEPCEQCKNCIKCECGYYQLGETEKDEQLIKAKELLNMFLRLHYSLIVDEKTLFDKVENFLKDSEVEK